MGMFVAIVSSVSAGADVASAASGGRTVDLDKVGVRITVPRHWVTADLTRASVKKEIIREATRPQSSADKALSTYLKSVGGFLSDNLLMFACKPQRGICGDNVNVVSLPGAPPPVGHEDEIKAGLEADGTFHNIVVTDAVVGGVPAVEVRGEAQKLRNGSTVVLHGTEYFVPTKTGAVEITFTTDDEGSVNSDVQSMLRSIRLHS